VSDGAEWGATFSGTSMSAYEDSLVGPLFVPWGEHLLSAVGVRVGDAVVDVACGPGTVARLAAVRSGSTGSVVGCDLSDEMLSIARAKSDVDGASIDYRRCSAESLSVEDNTFDVAVCQQGLQFFGDRVRALRELRRSLRSGGRAGVSVWSEIESCEPFAAIETAITEVLGADDAAGYRNGPWGLIDGELLVGEMSAAGFADIALSRDEITVVFDNADHLIATLGAAPIGAKVQQLDESGYQELRIAVENATAALTHNGVIRGTTTAHTVIGTT
jgi:SAM-dependent methyltransferase